MSSNARPFVTVILCAHDPRPDHLAATLESLRRQDLPRDRWELIAVDNNSTPPLHTLCDLSWHPSARIVLEPGQGLAHARRRGYLESVGDLIVHSDDDNVLAPDYLTVACRIFQDHPHIGTFGGQLVPRFEEPPQSELQRAFGEGRALDGDRWSNLIDDTRTMPWGAGMCLQRSVIEAYLKQVEIDPRRLLLGRVGARLQTGEDLDLNYVSVETGLGTGLFKALTLEHFIPKEHMSEDHYIRYKGEANGYSVALLHFLHFGTTKALDLSVPARILRWSRRRFRMSSLERSREVAWMRGVRNAHADMARWGWLDPAKSPE